MNLRHIIYLLSSVWLLVALLLVNVAIYVLFYQLTTNSELARLAQQTEHIANAIKPDNEINPSRLLQAYLPANGMIRVIDGSDHLIQSIKDPDLIHFEPDTQFHHSQSTQLREIDGNTYAVAYFPVIWNEGQIVTLEVTESLQETEENLNALKIVLIVASLIVIIPSFFGGRLLSHLILKPIQTMIETMKDIQQSGVFKKINLRKKHKDELYEMGATFNNMMDILQNNYEKQRQFVSDASHELKTPLTVIESYANLLKRWGTKKPDVLEESVDAIHSEAVRMKEMTKQMLLLANNDEDLNLNLTSVDLVQLCEETGNMFENTYHRDVNVKATDGEVFIRADEAKLKQVLFILLDNALKYSSRAIDIQVGKGRENVFFSVTDYGAGIPEEDLHHVFDRFFRVDQARSRKNGGTGLGLAIAKQIIEAHNGYVRVDSEEGEGTEITVFLPF